jgi:phosphoribosylpyrophosphate synthetase
MELLIMAYACKTSSAKSIVGVIPYLPYSKQCKYEIRGCINSKTKDSLPYATADVLTVVSKR